MSPFEPALFLLNFTTANFLLQKNFSKMRSLPPQTISAAISLLQSGYTTRETASRLNVGKSTVARLRKSRLSDLEKPKTGPRNKLSSQQKRLIVRKITSGKVDTA